MTESKRDFLEIDELSHAELATLLDTMVAWKADPTLHATFEDIATALNQHVGDDDASTTPDGIEDAPPREDDIESLRDLASGAPVVRAVNDLLEMALELRASDIHFEPSRAGLAVRMRVDGLLRAVTAPVGVVPQAVISRIKIIASLNIAERRLPQDGAARLRIGRLELDIRVAIMPTQHGESAVIRLLPKDRGLLSVGKLGFSSRDEATLRRMLAVPHGMIVICGPTGSGKSTTLAAMIDEINSTRNCNIVTVDDQRIGRGSAFRLKDLGHGLRVRGVGPETVNGLGGERDESPLPEHVGRFRDRFRIGFQ